MSKLEEVTELMDMWFAMASMYDTKFRKTNNFSEQREYIVLRDMYRNRALDLKAILG